MLHPANLAEAFAMRLSIRRSSKLSPSRTLLAALLTLTLPVASFADTLDRAKIDALLDRLDEKRQAMGSLVIAKDGEIIYSRAIGHGEISGAEMKPLTEASRFAIASITKTYTAVMILQLAEEGKLKLTDTLDKYLPQVPNAQKITIEQILAHRSGIPNVIGDRESRRDDSARMTRDDMLALIVNAAPDFEPDSKAAYSNSGYFLLGLVIEQVTGKSYGQALEEMITAPLGLEDTYMVAERVDVAKNESLTYWRLGDGWKPGRETHPVIFEIVSTPSDMAKFAAALFDRKLVSPESLDQMKTIRDGEGLGIVPLTFAERTFYGNTGGGDNYGSWLMYLPDEKLVISYATNAKVHPVKDIIGGLVDIYFNRPFEIPAFESIAVSPEILDKYVGVYSRDGAPKKWTVTRDGGALLVRPGDEDAIAVEATADDKFQLFHGIVTFEFDAAKGQMILKRGPLPMVFTKEK
jgi:D-alanyl-D-alanine carboxypeptidase